MTICVGDQDNNRYHYKYLHQNSKEVIVNFPKKSQQEYKVGIVKEGVVGYD